MVQVSESVARGDLSLANSLSLVANKLPLHASALPRTIPVYVRYLLDSLPIYCKLEVRISFVLVRL